MANYAPTIQGLISYLGVYGGAIDLWRNFREITPADYPSAGIYINRPIHLRGDSPMYTALIPIMAVDKYPIFIQPDPLINCSGIELSRFHLGNPNTGTCEGSDGILIYTGSAGEYCPNLRITDLNIGLGAGWGIHHIHNPGAGPEGGMWCATFERLALKRGIFLENSGDSIAMRDLNISGSMTGIKVHLMPGATGPFVQNANITSNGGAIRHVRGHRFSYTDLNIEHFSGNGERGAVVDIGGPSYPIEGGNIHNALISSFGASACDTLLRIENCTCTTIDSLTLLTDRPGITGLVIAPSCVGVKIGNVAHRGLATPILDQGVGTVFTGTWRVLPP